MLDDQKSWLCQKCSTRSDKGDKALDIMNSRETPSATTALVSIRGSQSLVSGATSPCGPVAVHYKLTNHIYSPFAHPPHLGHDLKPGPCTSHTSLRHHLAAHQWIDIRVPKTKQTKIRQKPGPATTKGVSR